MRLVVLAAAGFLLFTATGCKQDPKKQRLAWNLKTLVEAYEKAGHTSPKWNESAKRALTEFAHSRSQCTESNEAWGLIISTNCIAAVAAGCDDPMIRYLYTRFSMNQTNSAQAFTDAFCQTAKDMQKSTYPPVRKFYAAARALDQIIYTYGTNTANQPIWGEYTPLMGQNVEPALNDKTTPAHEAYEIANEALYLISGDTNQYQQAYHCVEKLMLENWPNDYTTWLLKGRAFIDMAWHARGSGWAYTVSDKGWEHFNERLATAEEALEHAWKLNSKDPEIAHQMMTVMLGQGGGRDRMELWFNRAMALDPNDYDACSKKLYYLKLCLISGANVYRTQIGPVGSPWCWSMPIGTFVVGTLTNQNKPITGNNPMSGPTLNPPTTVSFNSTPIPSVTTSITLGTHIKPDSGMY
jgi:tetratricopeptide (TPR) repeat protein